MYSYTTSRRESVQACHYSLFMFTSEKPETKWEKPKTTARTKSEKPLVFLPQTENQVLIKGKPENRRRHQNRKTAVFCCENRKTDLKNGQNRKTEDPKVPLNYIIINRITSNDILDLL